MAVRLYLIALAITVSLALVLFFYGIGLSQPAPSLDVNDSEASDSPYPLPDIQSREGDYCKSDEDCNCSEAVFCYCVNNGCAISQQPASQQPASQQPGSQQSGEPAAMAPRSNKPASLRQIADIVYMRDESPKPSWVIERERLPGQHPWEDSIYIATSDDGLNFNNKKLFLDHAGVPNLVFTKEGLLIATFQYFSYTHEDFFDIIAYTVSDDFGESWSPVRPLVVEGVCPGTHCCDPTLVQLDNGSLRLYFTNDVQPDGLALYSALGDNISSPFRDESLRLKSGVLLDPAVVYFNGNWHHYTVRHGETRRGKSVNIHSVSKDGMDFVLQDDILLDMQFLGDVIVDDGKLRFYGTAGAVRSAVSDDGYNWKMEAGVRAPGADPGVAKLADGRYIMLYTGSASMP